mgnify:CR=1 FL=1
MSIWLVSLKRSMTEYQTAQFLVISHTEYTKEEYVQLRKTNQELLADLENQISDLQEKVANQEPDAEEKIEQLTQYSMLEQYDGDVLSNIIDKVLIYNDKDIEVVFKGENFIRNAV